jgi:hypothetical protein
MNAFRQQPMPLPNTYGLFQHLDSYETGITTVIAEPQYYCLPSATINTFKLLLDADIWEPWPPNPKDFLRSSLAAHCLWLASHPKSLRVVQEYAGQHWAACDCFPAFGHIHILYAAITDDNDELPWAVAHKLPPSPDGDDNGDEEGPVYLPADLCICDCAMKAAHVELCETGPFRLLSHWLSEYGEWKRLSRAHLPPGTDWNAFVMELYCVTWPVDSIHLLSHRMRERDTHHQWLPSVVEAVVSNRDIDAVVLQCAASLLLLPSPPSLMRAIWNSIRTNPSGEHTVIVQWLFTTHNRRGRIQWTTVADRLPPAVWRAAVPIFNNATDNPLCEIDNVIVTISVSNAGDIVLCRVPHNDGDFVWLDGHILCC